MVIFIAHQGLSAQRQDLESFQKFDDAIPIVIAQGQESLTRRARLSAMCQDRSVHRGEVAVMKNGG